MRDRATATLTTIVVDDEQLACDELSYLLRDFPEVEVIATGSNGLQALELIRKMEPEIVFLDVHMPGLDGMGVVRRLREAGADLPYFIFVTAYDQYAVEAFRLEALDYLLKPVDKARLAETIERARRAIQEKKAPEAAAAPKSAAPGQPIRAAQPVAGAGQQPAIHRACQRGDLRHHRRWPDHAGDHQRWKASPTTRPSRNCKPAWTRSASGACTGRTW